MYALAFLCARTQVVNVIECHFAEENYDASFT